MKVVIGYTFRLFIDHEWRWARSLHVFTGAGVPE